jgi:hypothetical protein
MNGLAKTSGRKRVPVIQILKPKEGMIENPFHQATLRNKTCPCFSGEKVKNCHGRDPYIEEDSCVKLLHSMGQREQMIRERDKNE